MAQANVSLTAHTPSIHHPALKTTFFGVQHELSTSSTRLWHFKGIKYGSIPARFTKASLFTSYPPRTDATHHGPICPQSRMRSNEERILFGLDDDQVPKSHLRHDEFECLNLNIIAPGETPLDAKLPVMVWIHGGSNLHGSGANWMMDAGSLVRKSILDGTPVMVVSINYRLGLFGFAASPALLESNSVFESGVGNYGLHDQRLALSWLHRFIPSFGGDPSNITLFGVSSGAADIHAHLLSIAHQRKPLFRRAVLQSGCIATLPTVWSQGSQLSRVIGALGISSVDELRKVEPDRLVRLTGACVYPTDDGVFFRPDWRNSTIPSSTDVMIGDTAFESSLSSIPAQLWSYESLGRRLRAITRNIYKSDSVLRAYEVQPSSSYADEEDEGELVEKVLEIINDASYAYPISLASSGARSSGSKVYQYVFDQASPILDEPHHCVDTLFLFSPPSLFPSPPSDDAFSFDTSYEHIRVASTMQERWLAFARDHAPWSQNKVFVFGPEGETGERGWAAYQCRRRTKAWKEGLEGLELEVVGRLGRELANGPPSMERARY